LRFATNPAVLHSIPSVILKLLVLAGQEIEQQPVVRPAVDIVSLPQPADVPEAEALYEPKRGVMLHDPGIDRMQAEIPERKGQELRADEGPDATLAEGFFPSRPPKRRGLEDTIHVV